MYLCASAADTSFAVTIAFYISGHGFGHASRQIEIINALAVRRSDLRILIRTAAAQGQQGKRVQRIGTATPGARSFGFWRT